MSLTMIVFQMLSPASVFFFFFSSRRRHTRCSRDWCSDVCSSDLGFSFSRKHLSVVEHSRMPDRGHDQHQRHANDAHGTTHVKQTIFSSYELYGRGVGEVQHKVSDGQNEAQFGGAKYPKREMKRPNCI